MKVRWTKRAVRLRIDDLELAALQRGETLREEVRLVGGAWSMSLTVGGNADLAARGGDFVAVLSADEFASLCDETREGVEREGAPKLLVEKDFLPAHGSGA
ncbi:DUF7009 family protein [Deinococcus yavapaiensis]|nr:hypothetical protein [Deinococcus yavapaiensis]